MIVAFTGLLPPLRSHAQIATRDLSAQSVQNTTDVTGGMKYLLQESDVVALQLNQDQNGNFVTSLNILDTSNSQLSNPQTVTVGPTIPSGQWTPTNYSNALAIGRMFEITGDDIGVLAPGQGPAWSWSMMDPLTNFTGAFNLTTRFNPYGQVYTQVVMGNFLGNQLATPLVFYSSVGQKTEWAMRVLTPMDLKTEQVPMTQGPEFYGNIQPSPVTGTIVAGDFNGDGSDEIALLLNDNQTIAFYSVDPKTLTITKTNTLLLPQAFAGGTVALAAGHFRNTPNAELVAIGQVGGNQATTIYSVQIAPNSNNTSFTPSTVQTSSYSCLGAGPMNVIADAASILVPLQRVNQQLVVGQNALNGPCIDIGSFQNNFTFTHQSQTLIGNDLVTFTTPFLIDIKVGNFDNKNTNGSHNRAVQLEVYGVDASDNSYAVTIFSINPPNPIVSVTDWLGPVALSQQNLPSNGNQFLATDAVIGDLQGRSLRLGPPEVVTIPTQLQPDIVLGLPPMHIDWVTPTTPFMNTNLHPGCNTTTQPCVLNLTVLPSVPAPSTGFSTGFAFTSNSDTQATRKTTTSWGVSVKETTNAKVSFGNALIGSGSVDVKNSAQYAHDNVVAHTYNTFQGTSQSVTATTGFADHVFYTEKDMNIYYYPILGQETCPKDIPNCTQGQMQPTYVEFSVPDQVTHFDLDGTTLEWYQPLHEAGNVLSYPWNLGQLQQQFINTAMPLSQNPAPVQGTDSSQTTYTTSWTGGSSQSNSSGSTNSFSDDASISVSAKAGISGIASGSLSQSVDIGKSSSLSTLNENTASVSASTGVAINKPAFDSEVATCCLYNFAGYIFGQNNPNNPPYQNILVSDPNGKPADLQSTGPLFVGFNADLVPNGGNGVSDFFPQAYTLPDVAVNHPARWSWSKAQQHATFNPSNTAGDPLDEAFYWMKGFFISKAGESNAPNLTEATSGDQLSLTARIYNYSLVDTNSPSLAHPAASIHARFYGQFLCHSGVNTESSCVGLNNTTCPAYTLCGNSFLIGETQLGSIPGFDSATGMGTLTNWALTPPVNFDTTPYSNAYLVYWVVTWMEDSSGNLIPEMPGHGLTANPQPMNFQQVTQVPVETYSNNVGLYGVNAPFFIFPQSTGLGTTAMGALQSVTVSANKKLLLEQPAKVITNLRATGGAVQEVVLTYYDGDPRKNGKLFDVQKIARMDPDITYTHRAFFHPQSCGVHKLYARAWVENSPEVIGDITTSVTIQPVDLVNSLITSTSGAEMAPGLRRNLLLLLNRALQDFQQDHTPAAVSALTSYIKKLSLTSGRDIRADRADRLIGQANVITGCAPYSASTSKPKASAINLISLDKTITAK